MAAPDPDAVGILASVQRLGRSLLGLVHTRIELFAVELQEEKLRAINLALWLTVAIALLIAAILLAVGTLALFLWQWAGYLGLIGLTVAAFAAAAATVWALRRRIQHEPQAFSGTTAEFRKDMEWMRPHE